MGVQNRFGISDLAELGNNREAQNWVAGQIEQRSKVEQMGAFSARLSKKIVELQGINPIVYNALATTMHYRALFCHYKKEDPVGYQRFLTSIASVRVTPVVKTPTVQEAY